MPNRSRKSQRPEPSSLVALVLRAGFLKKKFPFFQKGYWATGLLGSPIFRFLF